MGYIYGHQILFSFGIARNKELKLRMENLRKELVCCFGVLRKLFWTNLDKKSEWIVIWNRHVQSVVIQQALTRPFRVWKTIKRYWTKMKRVNGIDLENREQTSLFDLRRQRTTALSKDSLEIHSSLKATTCLNFSSPLFEKYPICKVVNSNPQKFSTWRNFHR